MLARINASITAAMLAALCGCAFTSNVTPVGPDTYFVSARAAPVRGGIEAARPMALQEASDYCTKLGKQVLVKSIDVADVTFRCLAPGDPDLQRPTEIRRRADVIIEQR